MCEDSENTSTLSLGLQRAGYPVNTGELEVNIHTDYIPALGYLEPEKWVKVNLDY